MESKPLIAGYHGSWMRYAARGRRHRDECYQSVLDPAGPGEGVAYLRVRGDREQLLLGDCRTAAAVELTEPGYVWSPCFAGRYLFWVERRGTAWQLRAAPKHTPDPAAAVEAVATAGRPLNLSAWPAEGERPALLVWEERQGVRTRIRFCQVDEHGCGVPRDATDGSCNAYDPVVCRAADGNLQVAYTAFHEGQYRILLQTLSAAGERRGPPQRLSNAAEACLYPSLAPRRQGGVWFSFTCLDTPVHLGKTYLQHHRYRAQGDVFLKRGTVHLGLWEDGQLSAPFAPANPESKQGMIAGMLCFGSTGAGRSQVLEQDTGRVHLLFRQHTDAAPLAFAGGDAAAAGGQAVDTQAAGHPRMSASNLHPAICLMSLRDRHWQPPQVLVPTAHLDAPLSCALTGRLLRFAFTADTRHTGWNTAGEWFDQHGELRVGQAAVELPDESPAPYEFHPYRLTERPGPSIADPGVDGAPPPGWRLALGHVHVHSNLSVCLRELDRDGHLNYRFMQDAQHSRFGAITDHEYNLWQTEMLLTRKLAEYYYFPGQFVAVPAYEWTGTPAEYCRHDGGPWGHVNVLALGEDGALEMHSPSDPGCRGRSLPRLWQAYQGQPLVTPPHHAVDSFHAYRWENFDPAFQPVVEIFEDRLGSSEQLAAPGVTNCLRQETGHWTLEQLQRGRRFGFIAGGDHAGLARTGLYARELTRTELLEAFRSRRCFATTGQSLDLRFTANDHWMGGELAADDITFRLTAVAAEPFVAAQIVRDGDEVEIVSVNGPVVEHTWQARRRRDGEFWYCRVVFENGELAWTSPIWLLAPPAPARPG